MRPGMTWQVPARSSPSPFLARTTLGRGAHQPSASQRPGRGKAKKKKKIRVKLELRVETARGKSAPCQAPVSQQQNTWGRAKRGSRGERRRRQLEGATTPKRARREREVGTGVAGSTATWVMRRCGTRVAPGSVTRPSRWALQFVGRE